MFLYRGRLKHGGLYLLFTPLILFDAKVFHRKVEKTMPLASRALQKGWDEIILIQPLYDKTRGKVFTVFEQSRRIQHANSLRSIIMHVDGELFDDQLWGAHSIELSEIVLELLSLHCS